MVIVAAKMRRFPTSVREPRLGVSLCHDFGDLMRVLAGSRTPEGRLPEAVSRTESVRRRVTAHLRHILKIYGWPGKSMVGDGAAIAAFFVALYAEHDLPFQKRCLDLMREAGPEEVTNFSVARLTDRILVAEGKPQIYGTEFQTDESGRYGPSPIEDEAHVDERGALAGLKPLAARLAEKLALLEAARNSDSTAQFSES